MGCTAEGIALDDVRASQARQALRERLHEHFDRWLEALLALLPEAEATFAQLSDAMWSLRQGLTSGIAQTIAKHQQQAEPSRRHLPCLGCEQDLQARPVVPRTVRTLLGDIELERPSFSCRPCRQGRYPLGEALGLRAGQCQRDVRQAAAEVATELPYQAASALLGRLSGIALSSERLHPLTNEGAEGLSVLDGAPSRAERDQRVTQVAVGRLRRPVLVLGIDGAFVPSRPESA